jgi:DNA mismatch repair protein MutS
LTQLADEFASVRNYNVEVQESGERILFLHRLKPGGADRSYGIEVGRLAGLPSSVIARARSLLELLEREQLASSLRGGASTARGEATAQLPLFTTPERNPVIERLRLVETNRMTPLEALALLAELVVEIRLAQGGVATPEPRA